MEVLSAEQLDRWFARFPDRGIEEIHCNGREVFFTHPEASCIDIEYPAKLERLPFLARCLATLQYEAKDFSGALLWFTDWGIWNSLDESIGYRIVEAMHSAAGQPKSFEAAWAFLSR